MLRSSNSPIANEILEQYANLEAEVLVRSGSGSTAETVALANDALKQATDALTQANNALMGKEAAEAKTRAMQTKLERRQKTLPKLNKISKPKQTKLF